MYFFDVLLGKVGSFIMLIFMVIQLAGSAGTYPVELSGDFVAKIHKFLPFTYTVDAFRKTIAGSGSIAETVEVLVGIIVVFSLLTLGMFCIKSIKIKKDKPTLDDFWEEKGLV
jgi:putative membrane protein